VRDQTPAQKIQTALAGPDIIADPLTSARSSSSSRSRRFGRPQNLAPSDQGRLLAGVGRTLVRDPAGVDRVHRGWNGSRARLAARRQGDRGGRDQDPGGALTNPTRLVERFGAAGTRSRWRCPVRC
jgi:hypothetical protein